MKVQSAKVNSTFGSRYLECHNAGAQYR